MCASGRPSASIACGTGGRWDSIAPPLHCVCLQRRHRPPRRHRSQPTLMGLPLLPPPPLPPPRGAANRMPTLRIAVFPCDRTRSQCVVELRGARLQSSDWPSNVRLVGGRTRRCVTTTVRHGAFHMCNSGIGPPGVTPSLSRCARSGSVRACVLGCYSSVEMAEHDIPWSAQDSRLPGEGGAAAEGGSERCSWRRICSLPSAVFSGRAPAGAAPSVRRGSPAAPPTRKHRAGQ